MYKGINLADNTFVSAANEMLQFLFTKEKPETK